MITRQSPAGSARMRRVASRPSSRGIRMSIRTTSGRSARASRTASAPSAASPTTSIPGAVEDHPEPGADQRLVVGDEDAGHSGILDPDPVAAAEAAARVEVAAEHRDPLPQAEQAAAVGQPVSDGRWRGGCGAGQHARPGVEHLHPQGAVGVPDVDLGSGARCVLERVGQRLLDDPVRRDVDPGRQRPRLAGDGRSTGRPANATRSTSASSRLRPGCGRQVVLARAVRARAGRAGAAARSSRRGRSTRPPAARPPRRSERREHLPRRARLDDHQADVVADDVVQLAGDPAAFGLDRGPDRRISGLVQQPDALVQGALVTPPGAPGVPDDGENEHRERRGGPTGQRDAQLAAGPTGNSGGRDQPGADPSPPHAADDHRTSVAQRRPRSIRLTDRTPTSAG